MLISAYKQKEMRRKHLIFSYSQFCILGLGFGRGLGRGRLPGRRPPLNQIETIITILRQRFAMQCYSYTK